MQQLSVTADLEHLSTIGRFVLDAATAAGLDRKSAYRLRLAVDEIVTNIIIHGYDETGVDDETRDDPETHDGAESQGGGHESESANTIQVETTADDGRLTVTISDRAAAYDPLAQATPEGLDAPLAERDPGGLGVFLAIKGVDEFGYEYVHGVNRNILVMNRPDVEPN